METQTEINNRIFFLMKQKEEANHPLDISYYISSQANNMRKACVWLEQH